MKTDGTWSNSWVVDGSGGRNESDRKSGKLTTIEISQLADVLAKFDLLNLKSSTKTILDPHRFHIQFGRVNASLTCIMGEEPLLEKRYQGIIDGVRDLTDKKAPDNK